MLTYIAIALLVGYTNSIKSVCPAGNRAISVDGSRSLVPKSAADIITPTADYPICSPVMSCPENGQQWAIHSDGSALTNSCETPDCQCTAFQTCPAYCSTLFRQFGADQRISLFQVIDPQAKDKARPQDPYDVPYLIEGGHNDSCFLTPTTINSVYPPLALGGKCLRGTLAALSTNPSLYVCAPTLFTTTTATTTTFSVADYMRAYLA